jgi:hypothetical protein
MKFNVSCNKPKVRFADLGMGDLFHYNGGLFIKTSSVNAMTIVRKYNVNRTRGQQTDTLDYQPGQMTNFVVGLPVDPVLSLDIEI